MKISKIRIEGFGKFSKKDFTFQSGLNVIYGPNESGKTTLANFILYTLSGFTVDEIERYRPWKAKDFGGSLILETADGERVELDLEPGAPSNERYLRRSEFEMASYVPEESGLDLEKGVNGVLLARLKKRMEEFEKIGRIVEILSINQNVYESLRNREEELNSEIEKLRSEISDLERRMEEEKGLRKRYVENKKRLKELQEEISRLEKVLLAARIKTSKDLWNEMDKLRIEISNIGVEISNLKKYTKIDLESLDKVKELEKEIESIRSKIENLKKELESMRSEEKVLLDRMKRLAEKLKISQESDADRIALKIKNLELILRMYKDKVSGVRSIKDKWKVFERDVGARIAKIEELARTLEELEEELERHRTEMKNLTEKIDRIGSSLSFRNVTTGVLVGVAAALSIVGVYFQQVLWFGLGAGGTAGLALALFISSLDLRRKRNTYEDELMRNELNLRVLERKLDNTRQELRRELEELGFESLDELKREYRAYKEWKEETRKILESESVSNLETELREGLKEFYGEVVGDYEVFISELKNYMDEYNTLKEKYKLLKLSIENTSSRIDDLETAERAIEAELNGTLEKLGCESVKDCEKIEEALSRYEELSSKREKLEEKLKEIRGKWEKLKTYFDMEMPEGIDEKDIEPEEVVSARMENVKLEISELEKRILELMGKIKEVEVKPEEYFPKIESLKDLQIRRDKVSNQIRVFPEVITVLSDIKDRFTMRYKDTFEKRFREITSRIGRDDIAVVVRDDLSLEIVVSGFGEGMKSLSRATRDLLELAYRLAFHDTLDPKDPYPLIIDNSLVRYDDERLEITLEFLKELSKRRQVILTTSDSRVLKLVPKKSVKILERD